MLFVTTLLAARLLGQPYQIAAHGAPSAKKTVAESQSRSSAVFHTTTDDGGDNCPDKARLVSPKDDQQVASPVQFRWNAAQNADSYEVTFTISGGKDISAGSTRSTSLTASVPPGTIKWRVIAYAKKGCATTSSPEEFVSIDTCNRPSVNASPSSATIDSGDTATLTAAATGSTPFTYAWYRGAAGDHSNLVGNAATFTTPALTQTTSYWAEATNACGAGQSKTVVVTVKCSGPNVAVTPASATIDPGDKITLTASVSGNAAAAYAWYRGTSGDRSNRVGIGSSYTTSALTQTTSFWVEAATVCGVDQSNTVVLTVKSSCNAPSVSISPASLSIDSGATATLVATAAGASPITFNWYRGELGDRSAKVGSGNSYTTTALTRTTQFWVEATNSCGSSTATSIVNVNEPCTPPTVIVPANVTVAEGHTALLIANAGGTQPITFDWYQGNLGDRSKLLQSGPSRLTTPPLLQQTSFWVEARNACGTTRSELVVVKVTPADCSQPPAAPRLQAVSVIQSGIGYAVSWNDAGEVAYELQEAKDGGFENPASKNLATTSQAFRHEVTESTPFFYRARFTRSCDGQVSDWSKSVRVVILAPPQQDPMNGVSLVTPFGSSEEIAQTIHVDAPPQSNSRTRSDDEATFTATSTSPWVTVTPASGTIPPGGVSVTATVNPSGMPNGTSTAAVVVTTGTTTTTVPISVNLVTPVTPAPRSGIDGDTVIIPAVAHADGNASHWQSDVRIAHTYGSAVSYEITFTPSASDGTTAGQQTIVSVRPHETVALDDVLQHWFGAGALSDGATGSLTIRALDATGFGRTIASSRLFNTTSEGTFGQLIPAVPLLKFIAGNMKGALTMTQLAQSASFRTNLGLVEGSGKPATVLLSLFDGNGTKLTESVMNLAPGEHRQLGSVFAQGIDTANARADVKVLSANGSVFAYASVVDNRSGDPSFIPAEMNNGAGSRFVIPAVADLPTATGRWQTDMRLFNAKSAPVHTTIDFYRQGESAPASSQTITIAPGETRALDSVLQSLFGEAGTSGALRIAADLPGLVATARTYHQRGEATYGQFVAGFDDDAAIGIGDQPLVILQAEESARFRTNVGVAEVSGKPTTVELSVNVPGQRVASVVNVPLAANEFRQLNAIMKSMGLTNAFDATVSMRVIDGSGKVIGYASVVDNGTQDPTFVTAQ
jgi:hypothetical protein